MQRINKDFWKRWLLFIAGLILMAFGVAFSIKSGLGTSPVSSVPYVINLICPLSVGEATIIMNAVFVAMQIAILRKKYQPLQLLQLPASVLFGYALDMALSLMRGVAPSSYAAQWGMCLAGIVFTGAGVSFAINANTIVLAGEGVLLAVYRSAYAYLKNINVGYLKIAFDTMLVLIAGTISLCFLRFLAGIREGTLAATMFVGIVVRLCNLLFAGADKK